ncbi:unnamed protein product [Rodentolepis nana]|uniref:Peptidylamidoglycolate lyase n=1 Tax=Rodentolepis nana TaxID=102285 RepID=A0A158QGZ1_RODNA|nr:unnamed protein product [Rodentolepis nana]
MPGAYPKKADDYICTQIPLPKFASKIGYVTGFKPIVNDSVHHIILSSCDEWIPEDFTPFPKSCYSQCRNHILYAWAHHGSPLVLPEGSAFEIGKNTEIKSLSLEVHYSSPEEKPDYATIELTYTLDPQPNRAGIILLYNDIATIPSHVQHFPTNISCQLHTSAPLRVIGVRAHSHDLNRGVYSYVYRPSEDEYQLIAKSNAKWPQTFYKPTQLSVKSDPLYLQNGDILMGRCVYDSMDRDRETEMGSTHADEMCNVYIMYTMDSLHDPPSPELCADDGVPDVWENAPAEATEYVTNTPPAPVEEEEEPSKSSIPRAIKFEPDNNWSVKGIRLTKVPHDSTPYFVQVSGIAFANDADEKPILFALLRGNNPWNVDSFGENFKYIERSADYISSPILKIDPVSGRIMESFGDGQFILPHGLSIAKDREGKPIALWVTDIARHQVLKFDWNAWSKPSMVLGKFTKPGADEKSFCQPADVAVASTGEIFVADGYCNQRVVKFSPNGKYITEWGVGGVNARRVFSKGFLVAHSIVVLPAIDGGVEQVCVADRERGMIDCYDLNGRPIVRYGGRVLQPSVYAITFHPLYK